MADTVNGRLKAREIKRFGWTPDLPDARDYMYSAPEAVLTKLPTKVDLRGTKMPKVYDQGELGSCTANAIGAAFEFGQIKQGETDFMPSRLFIYYNERAVEGTIDTDSGAMIRDGMKSVAKLGVCTEDTWPYDIPKFTQKPHREGVHGGEEASGARLSGACWASCTRCRAAWRQGYPFVFGFSVYESFMSPGGREDRQGAAAPARRAAARRARGARGRLRRFDPVVHRPQLVGPEVGRSRAIATCRTGI